MSILKKATSFMLAAIITASASISAYADNNETTIIQANTSETIITNPANESSTSKTETKITDPVNENGTAKPETSIVESEELDNTSDSGVDLSDIDYTPIDISNYIQWNGKTAMTAGQNYYVKGKVDLLKSFVVPENTQLVITPGSKITLYKGYFLNVKGSMVVEPKSELIYSGDFYLAKNASLENYGAVKATLSSATHISGEYIVRHDSEVTYSGKMNVYKDGVYLNYGTTTITKNGKIMNTGDFQTPESGRFLVNGNFTVTISGRASFAGKLYLYGEIVNSGVFVLEKNVQYYKAKGTRFAVSKSSRLIDYRYYRPGINATDMGKKGIDVSYAQGAIDWDKVKLAGINFAIIRASRGAASETKPMKVDTTFEYNITQATALDIDVGVYHYLYADTVEEAIKEAQFFLKTIEPYKITYPVVLDVEEQYQADLGKEKLTAICKAFLEEIEAAGYYAMIYANKAWLTNHLDMKQLADYDVWLAQWNTVPTYSGDFGMWQYSSKGIVSGIDGYVDLNIAYKDYAKTIRQNGLNNLNKTKENNAA